jgi:hypothetical protein
VPHTASHLIQYNCDLIDEALMKRPPQKTRKRPPERALKEARTIELSPEDQLRFATALLNPPELGSAWEKAVEAHRRLVAKSE